MTPDPQSPWNGRVQALGDIRGNVTVLAILHTSDGKPHVAYEFASWSGLPQADVWPDIEVIPLEWFEAWFAPGWVTEEVT